MATVDLKTTEQIGSLLEFETLISDLSSKFINLPPDEVDREIEDALRRVCELLGIDLAVLWQWSDSMHGVVTPTHAYYAQDDLRPAEPLRDERFPWPWLRGQMLAGRTVALSSLDELPAEAAVDRESGLRLRVKSNLCLPLLLGGRPPVGALAFNALRAPREWPEATQKRLQLVAQVFTNALARRRHEVSLRESEERLALAADSAGAGLWTLDYATGVFWATERARAIFGFAVDEVITLEVVEQRIHPDDRELVREAIRQSATTGAPVNAEYRILKPGDRRMRWIDSRAQPHPRAAGQPHRLMGVSFDVTDRTRAREALRLSEARLAAGADLAGLGFYEVDLVRRTMYADQRLRDLCGIPSDRGEGLQAMEFWVEHLHPEDRERVLDAREQLRDGRLERTSLEYRYLHPADGEKWLQHLAGVAHRGVTSRAEKTFGVLRDVTTRRRSEEVLRQSLAEIERLKDRLQAESDYLKAEIRVVRAHGEITGRSPAIQKVLRMVEQVAPTDSSVLLSGETGTGKELVAQAIHRLGPRRNHLMVKVNCAALPSGLVESELFGREKGAFTGALTRQVGRFEVADGSTLFLDEIGELSLEVQAKLLRVLETGEFERLGSPRTIKVDVRMIAATNRDLAEDIRKGRFREDLFYRLNVFPMRVPPLRERTEDIPLLVWSFLEEFSSRMGKKITQVPRKTMEALQRHSWPGNVRELRNVIEHGAILASDDTLRVPSLGDAAAVGPPRQTLAESERDLILRTVEGTAWRVKGPKGAAALLGLKPSTLYSRMKKLGIRPPRLA